MSFPHCSFLEGEFMSKAFPPPHQIKSIASHFKEWANEKGVDYLKRRRIEDHVMVFEQESGLRIQPRVAHDLVGRLVRQRNRRIRQEGEPRVAFFYLRPSLLGL